MVKSKSREERELKKCFQSYFTKLLYKYKNGYINNIIHSEVSYLWDNICQTLYKDLNIHQILNLDKTSPDIIKQMWKKYLRFYLKGGKATLKAVHAYLNTNKGSDNKIAQIFFDELVNNTADSDWDFCLALHPYFIDKPYIIDHIDVYIVNRLKFISDRLKSSFKQHFSSFQAYINDLSNQETELIPELINTLNLINYIKQLPSTTENKILSLNQKEKEINMLIDDIKKDISIIFKIKDIEPLFLNVDKNDNGIREKFKLYRIVCSFEDHYHIQNTRIQSVFPTKMFSEIIDISFSLSREVNEDLFIKSSLEQMLNPIRNIDFQVDIQDYPIAGLAYQIEDNIIILTELNPSKPVKRFQRFIEQIKIYCLRQNTPQLPENINISKGMILKMMDDSSWRIFKTIFDIKTLPSKQIIIDNNQLFYNLKIQDRFKNLSQFEKWCSEHDIEWFNLDESKEDLIDIIMKLFVKYNYNRTSKTELLKFGKKQLSKITTELDIIFQCRELLFNVYMYQKIKTQDNQTTKTYLKSFNFQLYNILDSYFKDLNMENKYNYAIITKQSIIDMILEYEIDDIFKSMIKKFNEKDI
jgi:hypothetical protein